MERDVELQAETKPFLLQLLLVCLITAIDPANSVFCWRNCPDSLDALDPFAVCVSHHVSV